MMEETAAASVGDHWCPVAGDSYSAYGDGCPGRTLLGDWPDGREWHLQTVGGPLAGAPVHALVTGRGLYEMILA